MRNVLRILGRDLKRLARVPMAWLIIVALLVLPATYAWVNIIGFWDPYGRTQSVTVTVANEDRGTSGTALGDANLGDQIVESLKDNDQLGWNFADRERAKQSVESGDSYAAIIIPRDFSERLADLVAGDTSKRPRLEYFVNEKTSPIAPKITDTAAGTLERQVNETFVSTASKVVAEAVSKTSADITQRADSVIDEATDALDSATDDVAKVRGTIGNLDATLADVPNRTQQAREALDQVRTLGKNTNRSLASTATTLDGTRTAVNGFAGNVSTGLAQGTGKLSQATSLASGAFSSLTSGLETANGKVAGTINQVRDANDAIGEIVAQLKSLAASAPDLPGLDGITDIITRLETGNTDLAGAIDALDKLNTSLGDTADATGTLGKDAANAAQGTLTTINTTQQSLVAGALPQLDSGLGTLSGTVSSLGTALVAQSSLIDQASAVLDQLDQTAATTANALEATDQSLSSLSTRLGTLSTDLNALKGTGIANRLTGLNVSDIADFMLSPTVLTTHTLYPVNSYGSGMAPLFTNLSMWVGAFILVVLMRLETDGEGIVAMTPTQGYLGRWALLALVAAGQGLVVTGGDLVIGVQSVAPAAFMLSGALISLIYFSIAFALATTFLHVGKALVVILIILQIPGASGLYPIEMMPGFFRALYPFLPFSHGIAALRETIGGFYGNHWWVDMGHLSVFAILAFALGLLVRPRIANLNRLFADELAATGVMKGEPVLLGGRRYSITQMLSVLSDREEYRGLIAGRAARFAELYPKLKRGALIVGLVVPIVLAVTFSLTTDSKLAALATWSVWVLIVIAFLLTLEFARDRLARMLELGTLDRGEVERALARRTHGTRWAIRARKHTAHGSGDTAESDATEAADTENTEENTDTAEIPAIIATPAVPTPEGRQA